MIVWCGRCEQHPVILAADGCDAVSWFGAMAERPWCRMCILGAMMEWPTIGVLVASPVRRRQMRDADTCSMGPSEEPCPHGTRRSRYCPLCDDDRWALRGEVLPPDANHGGDRIPGRYA